MPRYIDADIAVAQIIRLKDNDSSKYDLGLDTAINEIKHHIPTADVVPVVRCVECIYSQDIRACILPYGENGYCPLGERRTDDDRNG